MLKVFFCAVCCNNKKITRFSFWFIVVVYPYLKNNGMIIKINPEHATERYFDHFGGGIGNIAVVSFSMIVLGLSSE